MAESDEQWFTRPVRKPWWYGLAKMLIAFGPIPEHVAFIMDGNRRYARRHCSSSVIQGHIKGFENLTNILEWCRDLGVKEVTVYAFSLENFKRSRSEVADLMGLFEKKLHQLIAESEALQNNGISVRFFGDLNRLPAKLQRLVAKIELMTKYNDRAVINVCIAYTAQDDLRRAFVIVNKGVQKGLLIEDNISEYVISKCLDSRLSRKVDLLIRTSGEARLSDFMLWQCSNSCIHFDNKLWPDYNLWDLCKAILTYQRNFSQIEAINNCCTEVLDEADKQNVDTFIEWIESERAKHLEHLVNMPGEPLLCN